MSKVKRSGDERILKRLEKMGFELTFCESNPKQFLTFANGFLKPEAEPTFLFDFCKFSTEEEAIDFMFSNMNFLSVLVRVEKELRVRECLVRKVPDECAYIAHVRIGHKCFHGFIERTKEVKDQLLEQYMELELLINKEKL